MYFFMYMYMHSTYMYMYLKLEILVSKCTFFDNVKYVELFESSGFEQSMRERSFFKNTMNHTDLTKQVRMCHAS